MGQERKVCIIGGQVPLGIQGVCTAYYLTKHGCKDVTILEGSCIAAGASGKAGGLLALDWHGPNTSSLAALSYSLHKQLAKDHDGQSKWGYRALDTLSVSADLTLSRSGKTNKPIKDQDSFQWLNKDALRGGSVLGSRETTSQVHPGLFTPAMAEIAQKQGAKIVIATAKGLSREADGTMTVSAGTQDGEQLCIANVTDTVICAGPWTGKLLRKFGIDGGRAGDIVGSRAHSVVIAPPEGKTLPAQALFTSVKEGNRLHEPEVYCRPDNTAYACGPTDRSALPELAKDVKVDDKAVDSIIAQVGGLAPEYLKVERGGARVVARQACYLPVGSGDPVIDKLANNVYVAAGHSCWGILWGPATGYIMSELILSGKVSSADSTPPCLLPLFSAHRANKILFDSGRDVMTASMAADGPAPPADKPIRNRPRSSSISSGSPGPAPGLPLPTLYSDAPESIQHPPSSVPWTKPNGFAAPSTSTGWGYRTSLPVPSIVSPTPVAPGSVARTGRHRRTQSVSPPGFPIISAEQASGFAPESPPSTSAPISIPTKANASVHSGQGISSSPRGISSSPRSPHFPDSNRRSSGSFSLRLGTSPTSQSFAQHSPKSFSSFSPGTSPPNGHFHPHAHHGQHFHPSSHAALLSGIRSHALPHSPNMDAADEFENPSTATDFAFNSRANLRVKGANSPQSSPPFGPTVPEAHRPSSLSLEISRGSPEHELQSVLHHGGGMDESISSSTPFDRGGAVSPPLLPLPPPSTAGRSRSGSFGRASAASSSPSSLAAMYAEQDEPVSVGQVDLRRTPEEQHRSSPPPEPSLFSDALAISVASASQEVGLSSPTPPSPVWSPVARVSPRATSTPLPEVSASTASTPGSEDGSTPAPVSVSPSLIPLPATPSDLDLDLVPPPSPVGRTISLPPPIVAPAPLPPHLGGPPLHSHHGPQAQVRRKNSRSKMAGQASATSATPPLHGTEHTPKKHSPLASPAISPDGGGEEEDEEKDLDKMEIAGTGQEQPLENLDHNKLDETAHEAQRHTNGLHLEQVQEAVNPEDSSHAAHSHGESPRFEPAQQFEWDMDVAREDVDEGFSTSSPTFGSSALLQAEDLSLTRTVSRAMSSQASEQSLPNTIAPSSLELPDHNRPPPLVLSLDNLPSRSGSFSSMDIDSAVGSALEGARLGENSEGSMFGFEGAFGESSSAPSSSSHGIVALDDGTLSMLERIFLCAKSESPDERAKVAHHLADWLPQVDICEAVEYVLPLLGNLATDQDDMVKEVFAPQLDRIMWHFFTQCPLVELEATAPEHVSPIGSPVPSRFAFFSGDHLVEPSPTSENFVSEDDSGSTSTPPPTSKTSPSHTEVADAPRISATCFTSLLGALLTDQASAVAKSAEAAFVRFLCRLKDKPVPELSPPTSPVTHWFDTSSDSFSNWSALPVEPVHSHTSYHPGADAARVLEDEFITGIVLGLARLDEDEREHGKSIDAHDKVRDGMSSSQIKSPIGSYGNQSDSEDGDATPPATIAMSPEEDNIEEDGWLSAGVHTGDNPFSNAHTAETWGEPLEAFADSPFDLTKSSYPTLGPVATSSPMDQVYSSFSPDPAHDEEASIGKMVSMSLIGAIAAADCLTHEVLVQQILPEIDRMKSEPMFYVRKEAAQALGLVVMTLPVELVESVVLPLHSAFAADSVWHVRRAACLTLPAICKRLSRALLRPRATEMLKNFNGDSARQVRSGALEVCGELIYIFHEDPDGVPDDILSIFLGKSIAEPNEPSSSPPPPQGLANDDIFAPLQSVLDSPQDSFATSEQPSWLPTSSIKDRDRPVMCAFNLPAVALTIGGNKWDLLRNYHRELCQSKVPKVRQSLASSLHEIAKIVGRAQADECLFEPFTWFLRDVDHVQGAVLENLPTLFDMFSAQVQRQAWGALHDAWSEIKTWRRRESLAEQVGQMGLELFIADSSSEEVLAVLRQAFRDNVASVRDRAAFSVPPLLRATDGVPAARQKLLAFLTVFADDASYRNRMIYANSVLAAVNNGLTRASFEHCFLEVLGKLADDKVVNVRICVAKIVKAACTNGTLYGDALSRLPLQDVISTLASSGDRDVLSLIGDYYAGQSASSSPSVQATAVDSRNRSDSAGTMDLESIPTARTNPHVHGICDDDDEDEHDQRQSVNNDADDHVMSVYDKAGEGETSFLGLDDIDEDASMDLGDDSEPVLLERLVDSDFVELSRD
ncbi:hypothetical protein OIV83_004471 [Microbotryomycetes sp. JL201]|nr:hypothetical protein OIV83_004471 [Microbotryomycetes sp. JL201]